MSPGAPQRLAVVLYGELAGHIERIRGSLSFSYEPEYLRGRNSTPLSLSMPLAQTRYTNRWVTSHLKGLLPDNEDVRRRWATRFGLRPGDTFGLVAAMGTDAAGGAVYIPADGYPDGSGTASIEAVTEFEVAERLRRLRADDADWLGEDEHWSLAGAQGKFTLRADNSSASGWALSYGLEPSTHIIKPGISRIPGQALVEHVSMRAAARLGLEVAGTDYVEFEDQPAIIVERFDRVERDGNVVRVHQEDFCQVFGLDPGRKYEADRGPGAPRIAERLRAATTDDSVERFARAVIVNYLLGAPDAHAKNYSVLLVGEAARLAPLYDVASGLTATRSGGLRYPHAAMSIGGERAFGQVLGLHWDTFADRVGLPRDQVRGWVTEAATSLPDALSDELGSLRSAASWEPQVDALIPRVRSLAELTLGQLASQAPRRKHAAGSKLLAEVTARDLHA